MDKVDLTDNFIIHITETIAMSIKTIAHSINLHCETKLVISVSNFLEDFYGQNTIFQCNIEDVIS